MKRLIAIAAILVTGCTIQVKPDPEYQAKLEQQFQQHAAVINKLVDYLGKLQEKGVLPKADPEGAE